MSAIAGAVGTDGRTIDSRAVQRMLDAMPHRGIDGTRLFHRGAVALGHALTRTLPEARSGMLPFVSGDLALTSDARLDNRDDLIAALRPTGSEFSDSALIAAAYRRWGEECPAHLLGDFAFALWDDEQRRLFCARDHFGVKPFYYSVAGGDFAFGSEIKALFALPNVSQSIDEARIADFLVGLPPESPATFYDGIFSLSAAHSLSVEGGRLNLRRYWRLKPSTLAEADHADEFLSIFTAAVECRMRSTGPVGAMLSGGLDSSAIACVAAPLVARDQSQALPAFSIVFDATPKWNERPFIEAVLAQGPFDPTFVAADNYAPFKDFDALLGEQDGVFPAPGLAVSRTLYRAAADRGVRVLLNGHGGDEVVSHGEGRLRELAEANRWGALWREARGLAAVDGEPAWPILAAHFENYGPGRHLRPARRIAAGALRRLRMRHGAPGGPSLLALVNPGLAARTDLAARYRETKVAAATTNASESERHRQVLSSPMTACAFEVLDKAAASAGIELRYPFFDKRLVEFCIGLPSVEKLNGGWSRLILRRAMQGILPPAIQWRRDKLDFSPHIIRGLLAHHAALLERILDDADGVGRYVELPAATAAYERVRERKEAANGADVQAVWRTAALSLWLRRLQNAPSHAVAAA